MLRSRSAIRSSRSRSPRLEARYQRTHSKITDWSKWRPLNMQSSRIYREIIIGRRLAKSLRQIQTAVPSSQSVLSPSVRDRHIAEIQTKGRMAWQKSRLLQSAQSSGDPDGPMEGCHSAETQSSTFRQSENRSQDRRPWSQPDDQVRPTGMQARCMNNAVGRVISHAI